MPQYRKALRLSVRHRMGFAKGQILHYPIPPHHYIIAIRIFAIDEFARIGRIGYIPNTMRYHDMVKLFRVLAGRKRLEILNLLADGRERSVSGVAEAIKLSLKSTSKHLLLLAQVDFLEYRRQQNVVWYRAADHVPGFLQPVMRKISSCK